ncbi:MAG TPA: protein kinase [Polyangiaceae bacterium]|jgi:ABC-type multidrug transport system ATPase subunit|nr:protein kinase [Polyangiaceae bacterium]
MALSDAALLTVAGLFRAEPAQPFREVAAEVSPLLELRGIKKSFGGVQVLRGASLHVQRSEIVGLCGDNGAGKSTLVRILGGVLAEDAFEGELCIDGVPQRLRDPADARRLGIALVQQKLTLIPELTVAQNLLLGREPRRFGLVDEARLESEARAALRRFGLADEIDPEALVGALSYPLQQLVEMVRALSQGTRLLVLDEPTASLSPRERERLLTWLRTLKQHGASCLYVSHRVEEVFELCDRVIVLRDGKAAQSVNGAPAAGRRLAGRYAIHDEIAAGGMATVHLGRVLGSFGFTSTVAIKRLYPQLAKDPEFVAMLFDEARLASRVRHPNVVRVLDVFAEAGDLCLVMEYVEGESLSQLCRASLEKKLEVPVPVAVSIVSSILHGLHAAHQAIDERGSLLGLVHRDVSPQNVIVGVDGGTRLIDFGIAKAAGRSSVSRDGQLKGKIAYMAPEQIRRGEVSYRTDIYGASVILWELLTGERLFDGETQGIILGRVLDDTVEAPSELRSGLPRQLDALILRGLDRDPQRRFESARAMAAELEALVTPATPAQVGEWVQSLAHAALLQRHDKLLRMERQPEPDV